MDRREGQKKSFVFMRSCSNAVTPNTKKKKKYTIEIGFSSKDLSLSIAYCGSANDNRMNVRNGEEEEEEIDEEESKEGQH